MVSIYASTKFVINPYQHFYGNFIIYPLEDKPYKEFFEFNRKQTDEI